MWWGVRDSKEAFLKQLILVCDAYVIYGWEERQKALLGNEI